MNMYGLPAIQKYAVGGTILVNPDGTASYRQPSGVITQSVGGPNAVAALKAAYPTAMVAETIPLTLPTRDTLNLTPRTISLANPPVDVASIPITPSERVGPFRSETGDGAATPSTQQLSPIEQLYQDILKRGADPGGLEYYTNKFGETVEPGERELFIRNAVKTGELTQAQADELLGVTTGGAAGAPTAAKPEDMINRLLYQPILGRAGDPGGLEFYQQQFLGEGDTMISPQERARFIQGALESGELSQRAADAYLGTIPTLPRFLPAGAAAVGRVDPNFLRTAAPTIATNPLTGQPQLQGATSLIQGGATPVAPAAPFAEGGDVEYAGSRALTPAELGSTFKATYGEGSFIDPRTGKPVEGLLLPAPERNVVFGEELRRKEAELMAGMTPEERDRMMLQMAIRQGRTGIDPMGAGIAAIPRVYRSMDPDDLGPAESRAPRYYSYAEGGLANAAQNLAARGRYGDSTLVHMAPEELSGLRALARAQGKDLTINPRTGLPEAFSLKKLFRAASFILPFVPIPGLFGMSSLLTRSILSGVAAGASAKGKFDFKQALGGGLRAYALGSLGEKLGGAPDTAATQASQATNVSQAAGGVDVGVNMTGPDAGFALSQGGPEALNVGSAAPISRVDAGFANIGDPGTIVKPGMAPMTSSVPDTAGSLPPGVDTVPGRMSSIVTPEGQGFGQPLTKGTEIAMAGLGGLSIEEGAKEQRNYEMQAAAARREEDEKRRRFDELFRRTLGNVPTAKEGGLMKLAKGGVTYMEGGGATGPAGEPRVVRGTGDGMSDSVPATIEGVQEARLANDEFVIPADVVADIGNGSSDAGAKKLYGMMDRIRKARHGTTKQPPEINAEAMMPA